MCHSGRKGTYSEMTLYYSEIQKQAERISVQSIIYSESITRSLLFIDMTILRFGQK